MNSLITLGIICLAIYLGIAWLLPKLIGWLLLRYCKIKVRIGRISLPLSFKNVNFYKNGISMQIDEVCCRSSFFNSEVTKLVSINVRDIRINIDINSKCCVLSSFSSNNHHKDTESSITDSTGKTVLDFRNTKIPPYIVLLMQFIAAHMNNISVVLMNNDFEPGWFLHATAKELHLDGSIVHNARTLLINAAITDVQGKILRHCSSRRQSLENLNKIRPCLAELSFDVSLDAVLIAQGPLSVEQIQLSMNNARATVHGGLYDFLREAKKRTNNSSEKYTDESDNETIKTFKSSKTTNTGKFITKSNYSSSNEKYQRFAPIIPKNFTIVMKAATFSAVKENTQNDFSAKMQLFTITGKFNSKSLNEHVNLPMLSTKFQLQHLDIDTKYEKLLFIEQFNIDSKLDNDILNIYLKLKTFQLIYNHSEIYNWVNNNFLSRKKSSSTPLLLSKQIYEDFKNTKTTNPTQFHSCNQHHCHTYNRNGIFEWILKRIIIKGCAELWNVSTLVKLDEQNAAISVSHIRLLLEQFDDKRSSVYNNHLLNLILHNRHWSTELMIESLWWSLGNSIGNDTNNLKKNHSRGSPFFLGVSLIKLSSYGNVTKLELSIHTLRTEYSTCLAEFIVKTFRCIKQYGFNGLNKIHRKHDDDGVGILKVTNSKPENNNGGNTGNCTGGIINSCGGLLVTAKIKDITAYFINHYDACILVSLKEITLTRTQQISVFKLEDFQIAIMRSMNTVSSFCLTDFTDIFSNVKVIRIEYERCSRITNNPKISIYVLDDNAIMWNSNLHMHIVTLLRDMKEFRIELNPISETIENVERATATETEGPLNATTCNTKFSRIEKKSVISKLFENENLSIDISIERSAIFEIKISERHIMQYFFENTCMSYKKDKFLVSIENIFIKIDDQHIFTFKDLYFQSVPKLDVLSLERQRHFDGFKLLTNRVWITTIGTFKAIFPYDHDFSDAIQNEFVSLFKWLKVVHNIKKRDFRKDSQLPSDMFIQVKEFLFELSDDPFEVKLRDNYVLLVDEHYESEKREELFNERILKKYSGSINSVPTITIESLYASLIKKNSEIYIQRSKKLYESGPTRTRLFAWIMTDLEIMVMADPTIYGKENVTRIMREIDPDSPWPEEGLEFVTLWCRGVNVSCTEWKYMLRDFPQPMFYVKQMRLFGMLCGAEQVAPKRARRDVQIEVGEPFGTDMIQRGMTALKFYHDFDCALEHCSYAFGPCWEPVMAQCNLSLEKIFAPSRDPSPVLPFWDKMRLLFHGRLTMIIEKQFTVLLHASLDPYNTTEEMELTWSNECGIVWTNAKIMFKGDLNIYVRTASRYDDCRILKFPNLKLTFKLNWICLANPNDHHAVIPCAPDKLPEYSSNQVHDSFRAFRSQNLNIWVSFETKPCPDNDPEKTPELVLYGSTLRWFESLKLILSGVTRPTRRGLVFNNVRPRKKQLSRHYKRANLQMSLHKFQVLYWMSHAGHKGFQLNGGRVSFSSEYNLTLHPIDDGLIHRPRAEWSTVYMNCDLNDAEIWLRSILSEKLDISSENIANTDIVKTVRFYFLSVAKVSYGRETMLKTSNNEEQNKQKSSTPTHKLVVYDLKGAWTKNNRDVAFALFDSFMKSQKLKHNLGTEALKGFRKESSGSTNTGSSLLKSRRQESSNSLTSIATTTEIIRPTATSTTISKPQQATHATAMLQQLIAEADHKFNVYSDDDQSTQPRELQLQGVQACGSNDVIHENWSITLVNSQVLLKGCETAGYVILSAAKAEILQRVHRPVWCDRSLVSKTTWKGSLECMQYYATVSAGENDSLLEREIMWLTVDNIQEKDKDATIINDLPDIPHLVGSGRSVGGVVSETVGASGMVGIGEVQPIQLQRIVSRCKCEFFYVSYGDTIDPGTITEVPPPPPEETLSPWERQDDPVDAFTLMHHDLDVCTNSLQYAMILDIVNNLMLYVEPQRKQALEKLARMRFELQLYSSEDQKRPIQHLQTEIRSLVSKIRSLEKDIHMIGKSRAEEGDSEELKKRFEEKQREIRNEKEKLNVSTEKLDMMLICYKETQLSAMNKLSTVRTDKPVTIVRANEICFKHAQWRLTETDGQIGIADLVLSDFLYTKKSKSDDSIEHLLELGHIRMNNLIPREIYKEVLCPTEIQKDMPVDSHKRVLRVFCREKPPVGGISVKEHFEINVAPITIAITKKFYSTMMRFCFPDREQLEADNAVDDVDDNAGTMSSSSSKSLSKKSTKLKKSSRDSAFYVKINTTKDEQKKGEKDDVDKMKERAEKNKLFIYIKIPEVPVRVSYKGNKQKNFEDITDFSLVIPTLEYHNVTWTWLDLLLAMKSDSRRVILSQAIKQKLQIHRRQPLSITGERSSPQEEDKAKILFGDRHAAENRSQRKGVFKFTTSKP